MLSYVGRKGSLFCPAVLLTILIILSAGTAYAYGMANVPTKEKLFTFETPHFRIIYQEPLAEATPAIAGYCEEAYCVLTEVFGWLPKGKIDVLFTDGLDTHNGWATVRPHNTFAIYVAGPEQGSSIYQPGDHLRRTVFHELTHVLTMDMRYGYNRILSQVFGKVAPVGDLLSFATFLFTSSPVELSPRWLKEGEAVWAETEFAPPGRGQSTFVDMIFRCAVRDNNLLPYSKWYIDIPHWPYRLGAYLYGMRLVQYVYETGREDNPVGGLNKHVARSFLFNSNTAAWETTGKDFRRLAEEMLGRERKIQNKKLGILETMPTTRPPRLTPTGIAVGQAICAGPVVYFIADEEEERNSLFAYNTEDRKLKKISSARATSPFGSLTASTDGSVVFYTRLNVQELDNVWYEIRRFDAKTGKDTLVTDEGRYRAVDISPDNTSLAAVSQRGGNAYLFQLDLDRNGAVANERELVRVPLRHDLSSPRYSPRGDEIAYVEANDSGFWLKSYNLSVGTNRTVFKSESQIISPVWDPSGKFLIFSSDANGVYNLYQIPVSKGGKATPLTHVSGGLFFPSFLPEGGDIVAVGFDGQGPHLTILSYVPDELAGKHLPSIHPTWEGAKKAAILGGMKRAGEQAREETPTETTDTKCYNSFSNLRFDFWSPWLTASSRGVQTGAVASFSDPTAFQELTLLAGWESKYDTKLGLAHYVYRGLGPVVHLYAAADQEVFPDLLVDRSGRNRFDHAEEVNKYGAAVALPLLDLERQVIIEAGYEFKDRDFIDDVEDDRRGVNLSIEPTSESDGLVWAKANYFDGQFYGRSSSLEDGRLVSLGGELSRSSLGGGLSKSRFLASWNEYIAVPRFKNHVLKVSSAFGYGTGDSYAQGLFGLGGMSSPLDQHSFGIPVSLTLRGYESNFQTGDKVVKVGASYRFPFLQFFKGREGGFPFYSRQLIGEIFYEGGRTWDDLDAGDTLGWINSFGAEANYSMRIFRYLAFSPGLGVAYVPDRDGIDSDKETVQVYLSIKGWVQF